MDGKLFVQNFNSLWDILIGGLIVSFSFQFILSPELNFFEKITYSFLTGLVLILIYTFFKTSKNNWETILFAVICVLSIIIVMIT
jgi:uncharacterized membrane protein